MLFGFINALAIFQAYINHALANLVNIICVIYFDNILIYSQNRKSHIQAVCEILAKLRAWGLYINLQKSEFHTDKTSFLGFMVTPEGLAINQKKVMAIRNWPIPRSVHDIQAFLGFIGFYRRFIKGYSKITTSLTERTKGNQSSSFQLNTSELSAFRRLQVLFTQEPLLRHFDPALLIRVKPDASTYAIGAMLTQLH
jgi:hypothetical protein